MHTYLDRNEPLIRLIGERGIIFWSEKPITFKFGIKSHVYVSGRRDLTGDGCALRIIGEMLAELAKRVLPQHVVERKRIQFIGIPKAGEPLAAVAGATYVPGMRAGCCVMREVKKEHGNDHTWVDGQPRGDEHYVSVDNVITDGQSKLDCFKRLAEDGYCPMAMLHLIFVDRKQGGVERLRRMGYHVAARIDLPTIVRGLVDYGFWPRDRLERYELEMAEWIRSQAGSS